MNEEMATNLTEQFEMMVNGPDGEAFLAGLGVLAGMVSVLLVIAAVSYIIGVICQWRIFAKAGEKGWKAIIPFYNLYTEYKLVWNAKVFWIWLVLCVVSSFMTGGDAQGIIIFIGGIASLANLILILMEKHKLSLSFGHGIGFTLGLIFLAPIFYLILAFGSSEYIGPEGKRVA